MFLICSMTETPPPPLVQEMRPFEVYQEHQAPRLGDYCGGQSAQHDGWYCDWCCHITESGARSGHCYCHLVPRDST